MEREKISCAKGDLRGRVIDIWSPAMEVNLMARFLRDAPDRKKR